MANNSSSASVEENKQEQEQKEEKQEQEQETEEAQKGGKSRFFQKIPPEKAFSPGGVILMFFAAAMEVLDVVIPGGSFTIELIPEIIFALLAKIVLGLPFLSQIIPFVIERIPIISDISPTWVLKFFM